MELPFTCTLAPLAMARTSKARSQPETPGRYAAPALEKGLDIIELMASHGAGLGQSEIARLLGRTPAEIFRMLNCLERRSYLERSPKDERYHLSARLFQLAHHHPPTRLLLDTALPVMRELARELGQSCHLAIRHDDRALVVAQVDSPGFIGFAVRVGARATLHESCSGRVLVAFGDAELEELVGRELDAAERAEFTARLAEVRSRGFAEMASTIVHGITDVGAPVRGHEGTAVAALTVPCLTQRGQAPAHEAARATVCAAATAIGTALGGSAAAK